MKVNIVCVAMMIINETVIGGKHGVSNITEDILNYKKLRTTKLKEKRSEWIGKH